MQVSLSRLNPRAAKPMGWRVLGDLIPGWAMKASGVARPAAVTPGFCACLAGLVRAPNAACGAVSGKARDAWCKSSPMAPGWVRLCVPGSKGPRLSSYGAAPVV